MKRIVTALVVILVLSSCLYAQKNISFFRNDGKFNQINLEKNSEIRHTRSEDGSMQITFTDDILNGEVSVPISAIDSCVLRQKEIPILRFSFPDYPDAETLWDRELLISATLNIDGNGYFEDIHDLPLQVKGRGNSTWNMPKKPMRLKFATKTSLCGLKESKNFVLLNNYLDPSMMRNAIAYRLAHLLDVPYANTIVPCHVFINDQYAGVYTLTHKVGINKTSVNIDETTGMLFELSTEFDENYKFHSARLNLPVMVKDPDFDKLFEADPSITPDERLALWEADFNKAESLAINKKGSEAFDIESAVNYVLLYEAVSNNEVGFPKSLYIHKKSLEEGEKYYFGPGWDFDVAFNFARSSGDSYEEVTPNQPLWTPSIINCLLNTNEYKNLRAERLKTLTEEIFPQLIEYFEEFAALIEPAAKYDGIRWPLEGTHSTWGYRFSAFDTKLHIGKLRQWLLDRLEYLKSKT